MSKYNQLIEELKEKSVQLIAVSKTKSEKEIMSLYEQGQKHFGENKVQELLGKYENLPKDIHWHLIGHLQSNKVKYIIPFVFLIHSVDSLKLLFEIQKQAQKINKIQDVLLQVFIAKEDSKFGLDMKELIEIMEFYQAGNFPNIQFRGLMGMATNTDDANCIATEFQNLKEHFIYIKETYFLPEYFSEISMGMSSDYKIAIENGSTMVRIGAMLFGERV